MKLKHPETKQTVEVKDGDEAEYLGQGWEEVGKKPATSDDK